jgi:hypothetical protein
LAKKQIDLGLTALDELFMDDKERAEIQLPKIHEIPLSEIDEFPGHPFHVRLDEDMDQLVESIKSRGIITPVTLRKKPDGRYEIVSGHRRTKACELAGLTTVKAEIKELSRDEAIILMVESNLQRTTILPSEKAYSYKMRLEAMNRQPISKIWAGTLPGTTMFPMRTITQNAIRVVLVEPGKLARIAEVGTTLDAMQRTVGGDIEAYYPFEEQVCIVCNEEGKINGLPLNRAIRDADAGEIADIIAGTFFICDCSGESFGSLSSEQQKRYLEKYRLPERFFRSRDGIESVPYKPQNRER